MKIAVIGCGIMGTAFARQFAQKEEVILCDQDKKRIKELSSELKCRFEERLTDAVQDADGILLAVKPKDLPTVAKVVAPTLAEGKFLISILAGIPLSVLKKYFPLATLLRIMPNLALTCGKGVIGLVDDGHLAEPMKKKAESLFEGMGLLTWMPENKVEALTALTASGIGMVFLMIEAMVEGGIFMGFNAMESKEFVLKTIEGAIALLNKTGQHPAELKLNISSPAGTTIAGLKEMEDRGVRSGIINALLASHQRGLQMLDDLEK
ncbi:MAG: pyrroline-5-carboxylate reductase [Verrucomicrobia bacterium]|nr:pyrroline-5-carboxylate reductase [Verrucomicrobiota bacterium]